WITKGFDLLAGNLLQGRLRLNYLLFGLPLWKGRQMAMRHRMSADLEIPAYVSDLRRSQQILPSELLVLRCHVKRCAEAVLFKHPGQPHVIPVTVVPTGREYSCLHSACPACLSYFIGAA